MMKQYDEKKFNKLFIELVQKNQDNPSESVWKLLCQVKLLQKKARGNSNQAATRALESVLKKTIELLDDFSVQHIEAYNDLIKTSEGATSTEWKILGALMSAVLAVAYIALIVIFPTFFGAIMTATMGPLAVFLVYDGFARHSGLAEKMNNVLVEGLEREPAILPELEPVRTSENCQYFFQPATQETTSQPIAPQELILGAL